MGTNTNGAELDSASVENRKIQNSTDHIGDQPVELLLAEFREFTNYLSSNINPANVFIPELTRWSIFLSFASMTLTVIDKGTDGTSVVTSLMAGDVTTGLITLVCMYLSGIATICIWIAPGHILDICVRLPATLKALRYKLCCSCCGGHSSGKMFNCGCNFCHKPFFWVMVVLCIALAPLSTPILFIVYFYSQVSLYRKCESVEDIKDEETTAFRVRTEVVSQAMIAECFFESAPQALLQMYVLATQFGKIHSSQQRLRFSITIAVVVSSILELGLTVGGRWVDNLVAHPVMELRPDLMKFLLYTEAISFLIVRSTLICGTILVVRALVGSGLKASLIVLTFVLAPRFLALILRIYHRLSNVRQGAGDYVGKLVSRVVATILFYPVLQYQWTLIYIECETVFLGLGCLFAYYGEYGVKAQIELFHDVPSLLGRVMIYFLSCLYIVNIALRWTRVIYLLRLNNKVPENTVFTVFKHCQSITDTLDDWEQTEPDVPTPNPDEPTKTDMEVKKFQLRVLNNELGHLLRYFEINFPEVVTEAKAQESCLCNYAKCLNILYVNEKRRRRNCVAKFRPAEKQDKYQLGDTLLYAELIDLVLLRLHVFVVFNKTEYEKVTVCRGKKWTVYRDFISRLLIIWRMVHKPRCPQQFLSRCPTFKFTNFELLLDMDKASSLFGNDSPYIAWNLGLGRCAECEPEVEPVRLQSDNIRN